MRFRQQHYSFRLWWPCRLRGTIVRRCPTTVCSVDAPRVRRACAPWARACLWAARMRVTLLAFGTLWRGWPHENLKHLWLLLVVAQTRAFFRQLLRVVQGPKTVGCCPRSQSWPTAAATKRALLRCVRSCRTPSRKGTLLLGRPPQRAWDAGRLGFQSPLLTVARCRSLLANDFALQPRHHDYDAAVAFVDVSGFSTLAQRLALSHADAAEGAETLTGACGCVCVLCVLCAVWCVCVCAVLLAAVGACHRLHGAALADSAAGGTRTLLHTHAFAVELAQLCWTSTSLKWPASL